MTLEERRFTEWIDWLQDEAVDDSNDERVGLFRRIKEGLTLQNFLEEIGRKHLYNIYRGGK